MPLAESEAAVVMRGICKSFGNLAAVDDVDLVLGRGMVHALLGENGAGKTTLMNILAGLYRRDRGTISIDGNDADIRNPRDALAHGIGMVHQHSELIDAFTALDNVILGAEKGGLRLNREEHRTRVESLMVTYGFDLDLDQMVRSLAVGQQQKVEILRTLYVGVKVLILDEPTTHLTPMEVDSLWHALRQLSETGLSVVLVNHKLKEVMAASDEVTVLRKGRNVGTVVTAEASEEILVEMIMGQPVGGTVDPSLAQPTRARRFREVEPDSEPLSDEILLDVVDLVVEGRRHLEVTFNLRRGEIVGIAGVAGNGQTALLESIVGIVPVVSGSQRLGDKDITYTDPDDRIRAGIAALPDDRLREGILPSAPVFETLALGQHQLSSDWRWDASALRRAAKDVIAKYNVQTPSETTVTAALSGGNIQKLLVARAVSIASQSESGLLVAMNPTRGLDVGSTAFVHEQLRDLARGGRGVLIISEDLDELFLLTNRIFVLHSGRISGEYQRSEFDPYLIGRAMVGGAVQEHQVGA